MKFLLLLLCSYLCIYLCFGSDCFQPQEAVYAKFCKTSGSQIVTGDFDGNGFQDLLCHDTNTGDMEIRYSRPRAFQLVHWKRRVTWCKGSGKTLFTGDFNGDGRTDLCCHKSADGEKDYMFATYDGVFNGQTSFYYNKNPIMCLGHQKVAFGDFNGDGRSDMLCIDGSHKWVWLANAAGQIDDFNSGFYNPNTGSCPGSVFVGDFNQDKKDDILCYDFGNGRIKISLTKGEVGFEIIPDFDNHNLIQSWCVGGTPSLTIADINGDGLDDFVCRKASNGEIKVILNKNPLFFDTRTTDHTSTFCSGSSSKFFTGRLYRQDKIKADLFCVDSEGTFRMEKNLC